jgi:YVTN family beta-propeller protein
LPGRTPVAVSVTLVAVAAGVGGAACGVPAASGASGPAGPATVYVGNCESGTVAVIRGDALAAKPVKAGRCLSTADNRPGKLIKVGRGPDAIAITADGTIAYVANYYSGTVTPIRTATGTTERSIKVGRGPAAIAIKP